jgi:hypothetical protein
MQMKQNEEKIEEEELAKGSLKCTFPHIKGRGQD